MRRRLVTPAWCAVLLIFASCAGREAEDQTVTGATQPPQTLAPPGTVPGGDAVETYLLTVTVGADELADPLAQVPGAALVGEVGDGRIEVTAPISAFPDLAALPGVTHVELAG
ncbi:hypothetical protein BH24ACT3_BH24ACT3_03380 [soil metagenome]